MLKSTTTMKPPYLKKGDSIGIVAPARKVSESEMLPSIEILTNQGFNVVCGNNLFSEYNQYSGTVAQRTDDFQQMLDNPDIKAIIAARGGYGSVQLLENLDWSGFIEKPKWIIGYSDITVFHCYVNNVLNTQTIHGTMPINMAKAEAITLESLFGLLSDKPSEIIVDPNSLNIYGDCQGELFGGNLSILYSLTGTELLQSIDGKILFIEDLDEYLYHIDRMMMNLKLAGVLSKIKGIIVGGMNDMNDNTIPFGLTAEQTIYNIAKEFNIPVCFGLSAGHCEPNIALVLGDKVSLTVSEKGSKIVYEQE